MGLREKPAQHGLSTDAVVSKLRKYHNMEMAVADQYERVVRLRENISTPRRSELTGMPKAQNAEGYDYKQVELIDLTAEYEEAAKALKAERDNFNSMVALLEPGFEPMVIRLRYYDWKEWRDVAFGIFGDRIDYNDKEESYIRRSLSIHKTALNKLAKKMTALRIEH